MGISSSFTSSQRYLPVSYTHLDVYKRQGLIYQGNRIINWCPDCMTALSDAEVEYEEQASHLWHMRYRAEDGGEGIVVATTRPETMLGDLSLIHI